MGKYQFQSGSSSNQRLEQADNGICEYMWHFYSSGANLHITRINHLNYHRHDAMTIYDEWNAWANWADSGL